MNERDFVYWLSGFLESGAKALTEEQVKTIKDHLGMVVKKVTPDNYGGSITIGPIQPNFCSPNFPLNKNEVICSAVSP